MVIHMSEFDDKSGEGKITVRVYGRFQLRGTKGEELTPNAAKAQGLLALLAIAPDFERGRVWLQDKLWSDRGPEQGAASLRQALATIRRCLGNDRDILIATRSSVRLDTSRIQTLPPNATFPAEFLEGLDIADPEFNIWLASERARKLPSMTSSAARSEQPMNTFSVSPRTHTLLSIEVEKANENLSDWIGASTAEVAASAIRQSQDAKVVVVEQPYADSSSKFAQFRAKIGVVSTRSGDLGLRISLLDGPTGHRVWHIIRRFSESSTAILEDPVFLQTIDMLSDAVGQEIYNAHRSPRNGFSHYLETVSRKVFSMKPEIVQDADRMLDVSDNDICTASRLGLRAQIRTIQFAERYRLDHDILVEEAIEYSRLAQETDAFNVVALSAAANANLHIAKNVEKSRQLSQKLVDLRPDAATTWWSVCSGALYDDDLASARAAAVRGWTIAKHSPRRFWWDLQVAAVALVSGDLRTAKKFFEDASRDRPEFRPPLRYLVALNAHFGDYDKAIAVGNKLKAMEPDFSIDRLVNDADYPVSLLFRANGLLLNNVKDLL